MNDIKSCIYTRGRLPLLLKLLLYSSYLLLSCSCSSTGVQGSELEYINYRLGSEFQVNSNTIVNNQRSPAIATFNGGDFIITWPGIGQQQGTNNHDIYSQRFYSNGTRRGNEVLVNKVMNRNQENPAIATLDSGDFFVTWDAKSDHIDGSSGVYMAGYTASGANIFGDDFLVNNDLMDDQRNPAVASSLPINRILVVWESPGYAGIYARQFSVSGSLIGPEFRVNIFISGYMSNPDICSLSGGGYVIVWQSSFDGNGNGIFARRFSETTQGLDNQDILVNTLKAGNQISPAVAGLSGGGYVVVWQSNIHDGDGEGIFARRYNASGDAQGSEFQVNTYTQGAQTNPDVASTSDGGFVVTWQSNNQDGDGFGIYAQRYDASGIKLGLEFQVNTNTTGNQQLPVVTGLKDGNVVISWKSGFGFYAQIFGGVWHPGSTLNQQPLTVYQGETIVLNSTLLSASDIVIDNNTMLFMVSNVEYCHFERVAQPGMAIFNFTQQEVIAEEIQLLHDGSFNAPSYQVSVNNGYLSTTPQEATIYFIFTVESTLNQQPLIVYQGETIVLNSTLLSASDNRVDNQTLLFIVSNVEYCQFERVALPGIAIFNFTQQEVIAGEIQLVHDDSITAPSYKMSVSNGYLSTPPQEAIIYFSKAPWLVTIRLSMIRQGKSIILGSSHFQASYRDASPGELVYTVSQVQHGQFELTSAPNTDITQFIQLQIDRGEIQFVHDGTRENTSFIAWVSHGQYQSSEYTVNVSLVLTTSENSNHKNGAIIGGVVGGVGGCLALSCCVAITVAFIGLCVVKKKKKNTPSKQVVDLEKDIEMVG